MEKTELLACPYCDGEAALEDWKVGHESGTTILCVDCGACISESVVDGDGWHERAVEKWNRRTPSPDNKALTGPECEEDCIYYKGENRMCGTDYCTCDDICARHCYNLYSRPPEKGE